MALLRRRRLPAELAAPFAAFRSVVRDVERAKSALTEAVPSTRYAGRPLPDVLAEFEASLADAAEGMDAWRRPEVDEAWLAASAGLDRARAFAERVRLEAPDPAGFEGVIGLLGNLLAPLEAFEAGAEAFGRLRA
jgi:hypothetical protein